MITICCIIISVRLRKLKCLESESLAGSINFLEFIDFKFKTHKTKIILNYQPRLELARYYHNIIRFMWVRKPVPVRSVILSSRDTKQSYFWCELSDGFDMSCSTRHGKKSITLSFSMPQSSELLTISYYSSVLSSYIIVWIDTKLFDKSMFKHYCWIVDETY